MAGFLYYLPELDRSIKIDDARAAGLGYAFARRICGNTFHTTEPFGGPGVVFADPDRVAKIGFYKEQTWRPVPGKPYWIGFYPERRPGPADLARPKMLDGHFVRLADGNDWLVPVARGWHDEDGGAGWYHAVPRTADLDDAGNWIQGDVVAEYRELWDLATAWWDVKAAAADAVADDAGGERVAVPWSLNTLAGSLDAAVAALAVNYRLSKFEVAALGLFDTHSAQRILDAVVDWPTFARWLEKKTAATGGPTSRADGLPTADGSAAATPAIAPPSPTSQCSS